MGGLRMYGRKWHVIRRWSCLSTGVCCTWDIICLVSHCREKKTKPKSPSWDRGFRKLSLLTLWLSLSCFFINKGATFPRLNLAHTGQSSVHKIRCSCYRWPRNVPKCGQVNLFYVSSQDLVNAERKSLTNTQDPRRVATLLKISWGLRLCRLSKEEKGGLCIIGIWPHRDLGPIILKSFFPPQEIKHCFHICYFAYSYHVLKNAGFSLYPSLDILHSCFSIASEKLNCGHGNKIISFYEIHSLSHLRVTLTWPKEKTSEFPSDL